MNTLLQNHRNLIGAFAVAAIVGIIAAMRLMPHHAGALKTAAVLPIQVHIVPSQPTPIPVTKPPEPQPKKVEMMIPQTPVTIGVPPPAPKTVTSAPMSTNIKGNDPSSGLTGDGPGNGIWVGKNGNGVTGDALSWYAARVQGIITEALQKDSRTRNAAFGLEAKIWTDDVGKIIRVKLGNSTGDRALDAAISDEILAGLQIHAALPSGMRQPIVLRLNARRVE